MPNSVIPDIPAAELLSRMRGPIIEACHGYPEVMLFKVKDAQGGVWWFSTFEANYSPTDPAELLGRTVVSANLKAGTANLTIGFSDGSTFEVTDSNEEPDHDLEAWSLSTPDGLVLSYGPGDRWKMMLATDLV